jgi:hypothetical protein
MFQDKYYNSIIKAKKLTLRITLSIVLYSKN